MMGLPALTLQYAQSRIAQFDGDDRYFGADKAVGLVFSAWPLNTELEEVIVKVVVLDRLYSTRILSPWPVAERIVELTIDTRLVAGDHSLVHDIANTRTGGKSRYLLSFASKYCAWHRPDQFQIFDSLVEDLLWRYRREHRYDDFRRYELRTYSRFLKAIDRFRLHFGLESLTRKQLDKFLWIEAKQMQAQPQSK